MRILDLPCGRHEQRDVGVPEPEGRELLELLRELEREVAGGDDRVDDGHRSEVVLAQDCVRVDGEPGFDGGAEWGGQAYDPETHLFYVNANEMPWVLRLVPPSAMRRTSAPSVRRSRAASIMSHALFAYSLATTRPRP